MFTEGIYPIGDGLLDIDEKRLQGLLVPDDINEIYDVEQTPFARGKFAAVRRAIHKHSGTHFAAKFLKRRRRAQSSDKEIKHEIAVLMLCAGEENIVKLNAVHETRSDTALLLELATGGELQTILDNEECLTEGQARICMRAVLKALQFLHNRSIAHLDLKPQNILLNGERVEDGLKLCDFGISRVVAEGTNVREIVGTPDYVAPEVLQYEPLSLMTDIWSVGVLAYVLLSGFSPFGGDTKQETFLNISKCNLTFPEKLFENVSSVAIDFIRKALRIKPNERMTAAGCLDHHWLRDECTLDRQIFLKTNNINVNNMLNGAEEEDEEVEVEEEEEDEEDVDENEEQELDDEDDEEEVDLIEEAIAPEIPTVDSETKAPAVASTNTPTTTTTTTTTIITNDKEILGERLESNTKSTLNGFSKMDASDLELDYEMSRTAAAASTRSSTNPFLNGLMDNSQKKSSMATAVLNVSPSATAAKAKTTTIPIPITIPLYIKQSSEQQQPQVHLTAARRQSSDSNKENTFLSMKSIPSTPVGLTNGTPTTPTTPVTGITTSTATILIGSTSPDKDNILLTNGGGNNIITTITLPNIVEKSISTTTINCNGTTASNPNTNTANVAPLCNFPDAPTTPKVIRKAPTSDTSPTSVKALVKKFQLEEGNKQQQLHHQQQQQQQQQQHNHLNGHHNYGHNHHQQQATPPPRSRPSATNSLSSSPSTSNGSSPSSSFIAHSSTNPFASNYNHNHNNNNNSNHNHAHTHSHNHNHVQSSLNGTRRASEPTTAIHKKSTIVTVAPRHSVATATGNGSYKSTCVFGLSCSPRSNSNHLTGSSTTTTTALASNPSNECRHSKQATVTSAPGATKAAASSPILITPHQQYQHQHPHPHHHSHAAAHAHHHHHHLNGVAKNATTNLSMDQGIIC